MMNRHIFFKEITTNGLFKSLTSLQTESINSLLYECEAQGMVMPEQVAYMLGTVYHEAHNPRRPELRMLPIEENGKGAAHSYGKKLKYGGGPGKRVSYTKPDKIYFGRGHTQNTWYEIYEKLTKANKKGWDFLNNPELLLQIKPSAWATVYAMRTGLYTGAKISTHINDKKVDMINGRKVINGTDKAEEIAAHASKFLAAIRVAA